MRSNVPVSSPDCLVIYACCSCASAPSSSTPLLCMQVLTSCKRRVDLEFMRQRVDKTVIERLEEVANTPFRRISYTEAVDRLLEAVKGGKKFEYEVRCWPAAL